jgi:hypothetical protein
MINEEGQKHIDKLRKQWVITKPEYSLVVKQQLLRNLYECQHIFETLDMEQEERSAYDSDMDSIIIRLEKDLENLQQIV